MMNTASKQITGAVAAVLIASAGYTAIPVENTYERIPLDAATQERFTELDWNSTHVPLEGTVTKRESWLLPDSVVDLKPTKFLSTFKVKQIAYKDSTGEFKLIDTKLVATMEGWEFNKGPFKVRIPKTSSGIVTGVDDKRWNPKTRRDMSEPPLVKESRTLGTANVPGLLTRLDYGKGETEAVLYPQAFPDLNADLIYAVRHGLVPRFERIVRFNSPVATTTLVFSMSFGEPVKVKKGLRGGISVQRVGGERGISMLDFEMWDSSKLRPLVKKVKTSLNNDGAGGFVLVKTLSPNDLGPTAEYPVYTDPTDTFFPDPDAESTSVDGRVRGNTSSVAWATLRDAADGEDASDTEASSSALNDLIEGGSANTFRSLLRKYFLFDTSSIPDTNTIDSATFSLFGLSTVSDQIGGCANVSMVNTAPASDTAIVVGDYTTGVEFGTTQQASDIALSAWSTSAYNDFALNATGLSNVSKTGISKFGTGLDCDRTNTTPTWSSADESARYPVYFADQAGTTNDPKLVVTHSSATAPDATGSWPLFLQKITPNAWAK